MSVLERIEAEVEEALSLDDGDVHTVCCRDDVALCGERLDGGDWVEDDDPVDCIRCEVINEAGLPCGAPFCRLRNRWRNWRSR